MCCVSGQSNPGSSDRVYNKDGIFVPPNPGDSDYKTYTYNNRRYGQYIPPGQQYNHHQPQYNPQGGYPYSQNVPLDDRFKYNQVKH